MDYKFKYNKYKQKYLSLQKIFNLIGGDPDPFIIAQQNNILKYKIRILRKKMELYNTERSTFSSQADKERLITRIRRDLEGLNMRIQEIINLIFRFHLDNITTSIYSEESGLEPDERMIRRVVQQRTNNDTNEDTLNEIIKQRRFEEFMGNPDNEDLKERVLKIILKLDFMVDEPILTKEELIRQANNNMFYNIQIRKIIYERENHAERPLPANILNDFVYCDLKGGNYILYLNIRAIKYEEIPFTTLKLICLYDNVELFNITKAEMINPESRFCGVIILSDITQIRTNKQWTLRLYDESNNVVREFNINVPHANRIL